MTIQRQAWALQQEGAAQDENAVAVSARMTQKRLAVLEKQLDMAQSKTSVLVSANAHGAHCKRRRYPFLYDRLAWSSLTLHARPTWWCRSMRTACSRSKLIANEPRGGSYLRPGNDWYVIHLRPSQRDIVWHGH
jgi:hypothetical protein